MPSSSCTVAFTGHTLSHGAASQCWQNIGWTAIWGSAAAVSAVSGSAWAGVAAAIVAAEMLALLHGFACITHRGNQVVSGVALNILAAGLTVPHDVSIVGDGLMTYSPIRNRWPHTVASRVTAVVYADTVPGVEPLLFPAADRVPVPVPACPLLVPSAKSVRAARLTCVTPRTSPSSSGSGSIAKRYSEPS